MSNGGSILPFQNNTLCSSRRGSTLTDYSENSDHEWMPFRRSTPDLAHSSGWIDDGYISPYRGTPLEKLRRLIDRLQLSSTDVVFDLGCGDGRVLIECARKAGCAGIGIDLDDTLLEKARNNASNRGVAELIQFKHGDILRGNLDFKCATIVFMYLLPEALTRLQETLKDCVTQRNCHIRAVVSLRWPIPGFTSTMEDSDSFYIYDGEKLKATKN